jgi:hypothetical protein
MSLDIDARGVSGVSVSEKDGSVAQHHGIYATFRISRHHPLTPTSAGEPSFDNEGLP